MGVCMCLTDNFLDGCEPVYPTGHLDGHKPMCPRGHLDGCEPVSYRSFRWVFAWVS